MGTLRPGLSGSLTAGIDHYAQKASQFLTAQALHTDGVIQTSPAGAFNENINTITNTGYYVQAQIGVHDAIFLTGGLRAEQNSAFGKDYGLAVLPRVGLSIVHEIGGITAKTRGSYGKALRAPTPGQAAGRVSPTAITLPNPELAPERQEGWDGGIDLVFGEKGSLSVTGYDQIATNLITNLQVGSQPVLTYQERNLGRVTNRGIEVEGTMTIAPWLQLRAQYGYVSSRIERVDTIATSGALKVGDRPLGLPTYTGGAAFVVRPREGMTLTTGATYVGSYRQYALLPLYRCLASFTTAACPASFLSTFTLRDFIRPYPAFTKLNAAITQRVARQLEAFISVDNLTDSYAYEGSDISPVIGRTVMFGVHVTY
jgi:outer membrane receptor protein involved in Fe transport